jgi:hypothetical protein
MKPIENRKHHYVPQFILRNFASSGQEHLHAFDKSNGNTFKIAVGDAAAEKGFYSFDTDEVKGCAEEFFTDIETKASPLVQKIVSDQKLPKLSSKHKAVLAVLMVSQMLRSKNHRAISGQIVDMVRDLAVSEGTPEFIEWVGENDKEKEKQMAIMSLKDQLLDLTPALADKDIFLYLSNPADPLLIGDSPLTRMNTINQSRLYGTTGLASQGVEIYLPLSPHLALAFMCPSIAEKMKQLVLIRGREAPDVAFEYLLALEYSRPITLDSSNVAFLNSQQVIAAERFVYSDSSDFSLVHEMLKGDESLRGGMRLVTGASVA